MKLNAQTLVAYLVDDQVDDPDDPLGFLQREVAARSEPIQEINIEGRRWFQRTNGHTYFSADIYLNGKLLHTIPFAYGYGNQYLYAAFDWLHQYGYIEQAHFANGGHEAPWNVAARMGFKLEYHATDVLRKRDL